MFLPLFQRIVDHALVVDKACRADLLNLFDFDLHDLTSFQRSRFMCPELVSGKDRCADLLDFFHFDLHGLTSLPESREDRCCGLVKGKGCRADVLDLLRFDLHRYTPFQRVEDHASRDFSISSNTRITECSSLQDPQVGQAVCRCEKTIALSFSKVIKSILIIVPFDTKGPNPVK